MAFRIGMAMVFTAAVLAGSSGIDAADTTLGAMPVQTVPLQQAEGPASVTLLSYNVEGLPWPIAHGRAAAADEIASNLLALRRQGTQPQVVAVQEAFANSAKRIGKTAGYAYSAFGPAEGDEGAAPATDEDRSFARKASMWLGERFGHHADSGLAVFSDYPIAWVKRVAFPSYACAGWDCFANKGVLAVALKVPGMDKPLVVVDTHLNSRAASKAPDERSLYAFQRQVDTLRTVIDGVGDAAGAIVMAGDYNVGTAGPRRTYIGEHLFAGTDMKVAAMEKGCGPKCRKVFDGADQTITDTDSALRGTKSLLAYRATPGSALTPAAAVTTFGKLQNGTMLSDHIGLSVRFAAPVKSATVQLAAKSAE
jgi:endonuclease/exonuclease/phosphatase family metal-dependent hydrolase